MPSGVAAVPGPLIQSSSTLRDFHTSLSEIPEHELATVVRSEPDPLRRGFAALELYRRNQKMQDASTAARLFADVVIRDPENAWAPCRLGSVLLAARKTMAVVRSTGAADGVAMLAARREFEKALALQPDLVEAVYGLISWAQQRRDTVALRRGLQRLATLEPTQHIDVVAATRRGLFIPSTSSEYLEQAIDAGGEHICCAEHVR